MKNSAIWRARDIAEFLFYIGKWYNIVMINKNYHLDNLVYIECKTELSSIGVQ